MSDTLGFNILILVLAFLIGFVYHMCIMKQQINVCTRNSETGNLTIIKESKLVVELDENTMPLFAKYRGKSYEVMGNIYLSYIVIN